MQTILRGTPVANGGDLGMMGRMVMNGYSELEEQVIQTENLPTGTYVLRLIGEKGIGTRKVIKE